MRSVLTSAAVAAWIALAAVAPAHAQRVQGCKIASLPAVQFGVYEDGQSSPLHTTATFQVTCKNLPAAVVVVTAGAGTNSGDMQNRQLRQSGGDQLRYQLFVDSARTRVWGDGTRGTEAMVLSAPGENKVATVYGSMPGGQQGVVGDYTDSIVVTVMP